MKKFWDLKTETISFEDGPVLMGILNVTPDSFSDGGRFVDRYGKIDSDTAVQAGIKLIEDGAKILDIGGESTRPGSEPVPLEIERARVVPVIAALHESFFAKNVTISIDTVKPEIAEEAIDAGAEIVNVVSDVLDPDMISVLRKSGAGVCIMHSIETPKTMQNSPVYDNVVREVYDYLRIRKEKLIEAGISETKIAVDPGIGFGKTLEHNLMLLREIEVFHELESPILLGHSRKRFIAEALGHPASLEERNAGTIAVSIAAAKRGVQIFRVHQVLENAAALKIARLILQKF